VEASGVRPGRVALAVPPFLAALIFAVHPIHTEPVVWVAGLPDVSFAFFYLLSLFLYVRSAGEPRWRGRGAALSVLAFFLATLCKEPALTLPFVLVALDSALGRRPWRVGHAVRYVPYAVATAVYLALRFNALRGMAPLRGQHQDLTAYQHIINVIPLAAKYLGKLLVPLDLNVFHVLHPIASLLEPRALVALAAVAAFAFLAWPWLFGAACMVRHGADAPPPRACLLHPRIGENTFAERYAYLPSAGSSFWRPCRSGSGGRSVPQPRAPRPRR